MNAAIRIIIRTTGALVAAAIACGVLVSAAPRIPPAVPHSDFHTAAALDAERTALAETERIAVSVAGVRQSEQRLAAQKAVAARAAAARAAAARARAAHSAAAHATHATTVAGGVHPVTVWTSGGQAAINACRGAVDLTGMYGVAVIAEHWRCGGASFPARPGSIVVISGLRAGRYKVLGIVATLNAYTQNASALPRRYKLLFQTCYRGDSHRTEFIALQKL